MNLFKKQTRKSLLELTAKQAQEIKDQNEFISSQNAELTRLRLENLFLRRELSKVYGYVEIMIPIKERKERFLK